MSSLPMMKPTTSVVSIQVAFLGDDVNRGMQL
jgi:hypothetical protein